MLLGDDSDSEVKLTINKSYADHYSSWRRKEEFHKLKARYGEEALKDKSGDESSSSEDDENAKELTEEFEKDFFKTLSCLKQKDPKIYDGKVKFFNNSETATTQPKEGKKEEKPFLLRDYERKLIVEREGKFSEDEDEDKSAVRSKSPTIVEEERLIKESLKSALKDSDDEADDKDWGGIFKKRHKTKDDLEKEEKDYLEWLKGQKEELSDKKTENELKFLHDYWNDPNLNPDEKFLKDYILNRRFLEEGDDDYIPTYEEIVHDSDDSLSEDKKTVEKQEEFEHKYNFRFEEPDKEFIKRYPRTMENSLRKKDDRRKKKRQEIRERKEAEETKKREELKRLKALKRNEIIEKIEKLKKITGNDVVGFKDDDLEGDFDPKAHDRRMGLLFNDDYYEEDEAYIPECPELDEELEIENWNSWNGEKDQLRNQNEYEQDEQYEPHCEDPDFNMDCDYDPNIKLQQELIESTRKRKGGRKWKSKFAEVIAQEKPVFDSSSHTFDEYLDEYYKLDFEDLIGDLPCRFKYRKVIPNSFGLSIDEILKADDKELRQWCSVKKAVQYRPEHVEKYDVIAYNKKAANERFKKKIFVSLYNEEATEQQNVDDVKEEEKEKEEEKKKKKKRKRSKQHKNASTQEGNEMPNSCVISNEEMNGIHAEEAADSNGAPLSKDEDSSKKHNKKRKHKEASAEEINFNGTTSKKRKKADSESLEEVNSKETTNEGKKKKKKVLDKSLSPLNASVESESEDVVSSASRNLLNKSQNSTTNAEKKTNPLNPSVKSETEVLSSPKNLSSNPQNFESSDVQRKKKKKKKKKQKQGEDTTVLEPHTKPQVMPSTFKKHKKERHFSRKQNRNYHSKNSHVKDDNCAMSDARLRAYGINPRRYRNKLIYGNK